MILYCDTSSLIKVYIDEPNCDVVRKLTTAAVVLASSAVAYIEMHATFSRLRRERRLAPLEIAAAMRRFEEDWPRMASVELNESIIGSAADLAGRHALATLDAIHLASFVRLLEGAGDADIHFSSFDARLTRAAKRLK